jgi:protein-S-isoprenylcysteine O-methyltransferase Ste14
MNKNAKHIFGYLTGFTLFIVLIPYGFYKLSQLDDLFNGKVLIGVKALRLVLFSISFIAGIIFAIWSNLFLYKVGKGGPTDVFGVSVSPQTKKLVTTGPYRYSRNPMVFGTVSLYTSLVILLNSITGLIALTFYILLIITYLKRSEEKRLRKDFGEEYLAYKKKVSMLFPFKMNIK